MNALFDPGPPVETAQTLSAGQRRTLRQRDLLNRGVHPITGARLLTDGRTCGDCGHLFRVRYAGTYTKCDLNDTHGAATDVRVGWPACTMWTPAEWGERPWGTDLRGTPEGAARLAPVAHLLPEGWIV